MKILSKNKRAFFDYGIKENFTAGLVLSGAEVKSVKQGNVSLAGSYATVSPSGANLINCHIGPYKYSPNDSYDPLRTRKLLLTKEEIKKLIGKEKGLVIIPLEIFTTGKKGLVKLKLGLARARKKQDKREYIKSREAKKEIRSLLG